MTEYIWNQLDRQWPKLQRQVTYFKYYEDYRCNNYGITILDL